MPRHIIRIRRDGTMSFIYSDALKGLLTTNGASIQRASNVEPGDPAKGQNPIKWYADMAPVHGPVLEGCNTREEALAKEVEWLQNNIFLSGKLTQKGGTGEHAGDLDNEGRDRNLHRHDGGSAPREHAADDQTALLGDGQGVRAWTA